MRTRVRRRFLELGRRAEARARRGRLDLDDPRLLLARAARPRAERRHRPRVPRARRARGGAARRGRVRPRARGRSWATAIPSGSRWSPPTRRTACATWSARPTRGCAARASAGRALEELPAPSIAGRARAAGGRRRRGAARARRGRRRQSSVARAIERVERCAVLLRAPAWRRAGRARRAARPGVRRATPRRSAPTRCAEYREALAAYAALCGEHREHRDHALLRDAARALRRVATRTASGRAPALDFEDLELLARDLLARPRRPPRALLGALRARARRRVPGHEPAPERAARAARATATCSASATRTSRSTASATPTSRSSAPTARRPPPTGGPRASP